MARSTASPPAGAVALGLHGGRQPARRTCRRRRSGRGGGSRGPCARAAARASCSSLGRGQRSSAGLDVVGLEVGRRRRRPASCSSSSSRSASAVPSGHGRGRGARAGPGGPPGGRGRRRRPGPGGGCPTRGAPRRAASVWAWVRTSTAWSAQGRPGAWAQPDGPGDGDGLGAVGGVAGDVRGRRRRAGWPRTSWAGWRGAAEHRGGGVEDLRGRAVAADELDDLGRGPVAVDVEQEAGVGAVPAVDGLLRVADRGDVVAGRPATPRAAGTGAGSRPGARRRRGGGTASAGRRRTRSSSSRARAHRASRSSKSTRPPRRLLGLVGRVGLGDERRP